MYTKFLIVSHDCSNKNLWGVLRSKIPSDMDLQVVEEYVWNIGSEPRALITRDPSGFHHPVGILFFRSDCREEAEKAISELEASGEIFCHVELYEDKD